MKTITEVRNAFWEAHPQFASERRSKKRQNDYRVDIRVSFCEYLDVLERNQIISEKLADKATL